MSDLIKTNQLQNVEILQRLHEKYPTAKTEGHEISFSNGHPKTPGALFDRADLARGLGGKVLGKPVISWCY